MCLFEIKLVPAAMIGSAPDRAEWAMLRRRSEITLTAPPSMTAAPRRRTYANRTCLRESRRAVRGHSDYAQGIPIRSFHIAASADP